MFCKNCGKGLGLHPDNKCPSCGNFTVFCKNCGKGLVRNPDRTCANCGGDPIKPGLFCRHCGKPTGPNDLKCPACNGIVRTASEVDQTPVQKGKRMVKLVLVLAAVVALGFAFTLRTALAGSVTSWFSTVKEPPPKPDFSKNVTINLVMEDGKFTPDKIFAETGANLIINFTNKDAGVEHNFVLYREVESVPSAMSIQKRVIGPGTAVYRLKVPRVAPDGAYWFACDSHYATEQGAFYATWPPAP